MTQCEFSFIHFKHLFWRNSTQNIVRTPNVEKSGNKNEEIIKGNIESIQ